MYRMLPYPIMAVSMLLKSWATPPASCPTASIFCDCLSCSSSLWRSCSSLSLSVMSSHTVTIPRGVPSSSRTTSETRLTGKVEPSLRRLTLWRTQLVICMRRDFSIGLLASVGANTLACLPTSSPGA